VITRSDIYEVLSKLDTTKARGSDNIHPLVLKNCNISLLEPIFHLFTQCSLFPSLHRSSIIHLWAMLCSVQRWLTAVTNWEVPKLWKWWRSKECCQVFPGLAAHITVCIADVGGLEDDMDSNMECHAIILDGVLQVSSFIVCSRVTLYQSYGTVTVLPRQLKNTLNAYMLYA